MTVCLCVCAYVWERESVCVCVCVCIIWLLAIFSSSVCACVCVWVCVCVCLQMQVCVCMCVFDWWLVVSLLAFLPSPHPFLFCGSEMYLFLVDNDAVLAIACAYHLIWQENSVMKHHQSPFLSLLFRIVHMTWFGRRTDSNEASAVSFPITLMQNCWALHSYAELLSTWVLKCAFAYDWVWLSWGDPLHWQDVKI